MCRVGIVSSFNLNNERYIRGGIIPVTSVDGEEILFFGVGYNGELTDFGGHREHIDKDIVETAMREYQEEVHNLFGILNRDILLSSWAVDGVDTLEIFYRLPAMTRDHLNYYNDVFAPTVTDNDEIHNIVWIPTTQLATILDNENKPYRPMYSRVKFALTAWNT